MSFNRLNKRKQTEKKETAQHLSSPRHSHSILWGHTGRNTLSSDESTTQWIDGSVHEDPKQNSGPTSGINGVLKTPKRRSTKPRLKIPLKQYNKIRFTILSAPLNGAMSPSKASAYSVDWLFYELTRNEPPQSFFHFKEKASHSNTGSTLGINC